MILDEATIFAFLEKGHAVVRTLARREDIAPRPAERVGALEERGT